MGNASDSLERGLGLYGELLAGDPELEREFAQSRSVFAAARPGNSEEQRLAARRHLEWFILERPSESLGGVPVEALQDVQDMWGPEVPVLRKTSRQPRPDPNTERA